MGRNTIIKPFLDQVSDYTEYMDRLTELGLSMFEWRNLPDTVDPVFMEKTLFNSGKAVFFNDDVLGFLCLKAGSCTDFNVYNEPTRITAVGSNKYKADLTNENCVMIYNNFLHKPSVGDIRKMAKRIYEFDSTISVNVNAQKTPVLITCEEEQRVTMQNVYNLFTGNSPAIFGNKNLKPDSIKVFTTGAPYVADKIYQLKTQYWNEALTYLGIPNINTQKKERLISDEVDRTQGGTIASMYSRLDVRKKACQKINKMFNLNIDVVYRADFDPESENTIDDIEIEE